MKFPKRYYPKARRISRAVHTLWLYNKLTKRRVHTVIRDVLGNVSIQTGAFRSTAILPNGVIKVPHTEDSIKSTLLEVELFRAARRSRHARHFPVTELVMCGNVPVLLQERVNEIAIYASKDVEDDVTQFAENIGVGDIHAHNYGWRDDRYGMYPVFVDCETSMNGKNLTVHDVCRVQRASTPWKYPIVRV